MFIEQVISWCIIIIEKLTVAQLVKKISAFYEIRNFISVHNILPLDAVLSQMNLIHILTPYSFKIHFNITIPSMLRLTQYFLPFRYHSVTCYR